MIRDITITSLETITAFDIKTGNYKFTLDELQNATIAQSQEKTDITGKGGRKLSSLKKNKAVTISGTNGLISGGLLELQTGSTFESKATEVMWTDYITVKSNAATTTYTAIGAEGSEISGLFIKNEDGSLGKELKQDASASAGKFTYNPSTKALAFYSGSTTDPKVPADVEDDAEIVVFYKRKIAADVLTDSSDKYSEKCALYVDAFGEDKCANIYRIQFYIPKADFNGEFSVELGGDQTVHAFDAEALSGACGTAGEFFTFTIFDSEAADAPSN